MCTQSCDTHTQNAHSAHAPDDNSLAMERELGLAVLVSKPKTQLDSSKVSPVCLPGVGTYKQSSALIMSAFQTLHVGPSVAVVTARAPTAAVLQGPHLPPPSPVGPCSQNFPNLSLPQTQCHQSVTSLTILQPREVCHRHG